MRLLFFPEFQKHSPYRSLDWRWQRAHWLLAHGHYFSRRRDDEETGCALRYLRHLAGSRKRPPTAEDAKRYWSIRAAHRLCENGGSAKLQVEAWILAGQTSALITQILSMPVEVVDSYESLFFNCRDRLRARDWIVTRAIGRNIFEPASKPDVGVVLKSFAYFGGPLVLAAALPYLLGGSDCFEKPIDLSTAEGRREQTIRLAVAVHLLPEDAETNWKLLKIALLLQEMERQRANRSAPGVLSAEKIDFGVIQTLVDDAWERHQEKEISCPIAPTRGSREVA